MPKSKYNIPNEKIQDISKKRKQKLPLIEKDRLKNRSDKKWNFSFQYWEQREYFGLKSVSREWFVDLLEILRDLSSKLIDDVRLDSAAKQAHRFHVINWENCSISKEVFYRYVPTEYQTEDTDIIQFQIQKSKGRVIGFFDFESVFQIVLLDPEHNMQLTRYDNYTTIKTENLANSYDGLMAKFALISKKCENSSPKGAKWLIDEVKSILEKEKYSSECKMITIGKEFFDDINEILQLNPEYESLDMVIYEALDLLKEGLNKGSSRAP